MAQRIKRLLAKQETEVRSLGGKIPWRRKWQPTPVFLPGESHGQRSLAGYSPQGRKELDTTERLHTHTHTQTHTYTQDEKSSGNWLYSNGKRVNNTDTYD